MREKIFCVSCGLHIDEVGPLSGRGLCEPCGDNRMLEAIAQIRARHGPAFTRWVHGRDRAVKRHLEELRRLDS